MSYKTLPLLLITQITLFSSLFSQTAEQLRANLYSFNTDGTLSLTDGNLTMYAINNSNAVDGMDAVKMSNFGENFGLLRGNKTLAIERRQSITTADTIFFKMWNMHQKSYRLTLYLTGLAHPDLNGILKDQYLKTSTALNLNGANNVAFTITDDIASSAPDRFCILFSSPASSFKLLPVTFTRVKAYQDNNNIDLEWFVENEKDIAQYQVEKSINGQQFFSVSTIYLQGNNVAHYRWTDSSPVKGNNFYRIKSVDADNKATYSGITKMYAGPQNYSIAVYPNPVVNGVIHIQLTNQAEGIYTVRLINHSGQMVYSTRLRHNGGSSSQAIQLNENSGKGDFILEIISPDNKTTNHKILIP